MDFIPIYSKEASNNGEERICGRIYNKDIQENGDVKMYCWQENGKLKYSSCEQEYLNALKIHKENSECESSK